MPRRIICNHLFTVARLFISILIAIVACTAQEKMVYGGVANRAIVSPQLDPRAAGQTAQHQPAPVGAKLERISLSRSVPESRTGSTPQDSLFMPAVFYDSGGAYSVTVADVNGDGKPDILVVNSSSAIGVLLGNGDDIPASSVVRQRCCRTLFDCGGGLERRPQARHSGVRGRDMG